MQPKAVASRSFDRPLLYREPFAQACFSNLTMRIMTGLMLQESEPGF